MADIQKLVQDPRFISGIYNYCDRWCERCAFTKRCLNYAMDEEDMDDPARYDLDNEAFWQKLHNIFNQVMELLATMAKEQGINLEELEKESTRINLEQQHEKAAAHPLARASRKYADLVDEWFKKEQTLFKEKQDELRQKLELEINYAGAITEAVSIRDAFEVIQWYQYQIHVKLMRALMDIYEDDETDDPGKEAARDDCHGSTKVSLIGIDRSIGAWGVLQNQFPEKTDSILDLLLNLDRLRKNIDNTFPQARAYIRPGFDDGSDPDWPPAAETSQ